MSGPAAAIWHDACCSADRMQMGWVGITLLAVGACGAQGQSPADSTGSAAEPIINGLPDPWPNDPAVVRVRVDGRGVCSGTLISPHVVLTAGHCIAGTSSWTVTFGDNDRNPIASVTTTTAITDPDYNEATRDDGILVLPSTFSAPQVALPVPYATQTLTNAIIGLTTRIVGFGRMSVNDTTGDHVKHYGTDAVARVDANAIVFTAGTNGEHECRGDSGGPSLLDLGCGQVIIGTVHGHRDSACEVGTYQRVDVAQGFLDAHVQRLDPGFVPAPCAADAGGSNGVPVDANRSAGCRCTLATGKSSSRKPFGLLGAALAAAGVFARRRASSTPTRCYSGPTPAPIWRPCTAWGEVFLGTPYARAPYSNRHAKRVTRRRVARPPTGSTQPSQTRNTRHTRVVRSCAVSRGGMKSEPLHLDEGGIPSRTASEAQVRAARLDVRALWLLSYIDGRLTLGEVFEHAGLPIEEARDGVRDLVRRGIVALRPAPQRDGAWILRST